MRERSRVAGREAELTCVVAERPAQRGKRGKRGRPAPQSDKWGRPARKKASASAFAQ